jgi:serine/threonine protein kinase
MVWREKLTSLCYHTNVANDFEIIRQLQEGGFGVVYLVRDHNTGKEYAAKWIYDVDENSQQGFLDEVEIYRGLPKSSGLCRLYRVYKEYDESIVFILELIRGNSLAYELALNKKFSESRTKQIVRDVLNTLVDLHRSGFVHRDITMQNL